MGVYGDGMGAYGDGMGAYGDGMGVYGDGMGANASRHARVERLLESAKTDPLIIIVNGPLSAHNY
eukprot:1176017-Prorocentrum_minimum.AAC.2